MTPAEEERARVVAFMEAETKRGDLRGALCLRERMALAWTALIAPERLYRGTARYWMNRIEAREHLKEQPE